MKKKEIKERLKQYAHTVRIVNTHSHHTDQQYFENVSLYKLMQITYMNWYSPPFSNDRQGREAFERRNALNTYYYWEKRGLEALYPVGRPFSADTWELYDAEIKKAYQEKDYSIRGLKELCGYDAVILDDPFIPGNDKKHPELFRPAFRCDMFLYGYTPESPDPFQNQAYRFFEREKPSTLEEYILCMGSAVKKKKGEGCVALKIAVAYQRGLDFINTDVQRARKAFGNAQPSPEEIRDFQDYVMYSLARIAGELDIPLQIHTGLGQLKKTNPMELHPLIAANPSTKFVLLHCGFPWKDDLLALLHNHSNVYPDLSWLPLLSTAYAETFLREALEVGDAYRLCWGCDTWTLEESMGARLAVEEVLTEVLAKMVKDNRISEGQAIKMIENILRENAKSLYHIK